MPSKASITVMKNEDDMWVIFRNNEGSESMILLSQIVPESGSIIRHILETACEEIWQQGFVVQSVQQPQAIICSTDLCAYCVHDDEVGFSCHKCNRYEGVAKFEGRKLRPA
jgi:hypothetical protein